MKIWRRGRDSNPRYPCEYFAFRVRRDRPLCHLSADGLPRGRGRALSRGFGHCQPPNRLTRQSPRGCSRPAGMGALPVARRTAFRPFRPLFPGRHDGRLTGLPKVLEAPRFEQADHASLPCHPFPGVRPSGRDDACALPRQTHETHENENVVSLLPRPSPAGVEG